MAVVTTNKKLEEQNQQLAQQQAAQQQQAQQQLAQQQQQQAQAQANPYSGLQGVNTNTAQKIGNYQQGYQQADAVTNAQNTLQNLMNQKPQGYESKYSAALDGILQRITNPQQFKYTFNGDELFKNYADVYTQKGKQAAMDVQGQAAGLTGGYGNSYGQMVGQQQYQQYLMDLYDKGMDLYDRAYQRYQDEQNGLLNQYNVLAQQDQTDYGRYRDVVGDWENERNYWTGRADTEAERDYNRYQNELNYWTQMGQAENADYRTQQQFDESVRQFNENLAEQKRQWDQEFEYNKMSEEKKYAYNYATSILANGQMPSDELLRQAGLSKEDAQKMMAQVQAAAGGRGGSAPKKQDVVYTMNGHYYVDDGKGGFKEVDKNSLGKNTLYDDSYENLSNNMNKAISNAASTIQNSQAVQSATQLVNNLGNTVSNLGTGVLNLLGLNNTGNTAAKATTTPAVTTIPYTKVVQTPEEIKKKGTTK